MVITYNILLIDYIMIDKTCILNKKPDNNNDNLGLLTKIWGPPTWESIFCIVFGYPTNPTQEDKEGYKKYFEALGCVLPCPFCRNSYCSFIAPEGELALTDNVFESIETLSKWVYNLRNRVNKKLGMEYGVSYEMFKEKYESYRAKCSPLYKDECKMTPDMKAIGYRNSYKKEVPIIPLEYVLCFKKYAEKRGVKNFVEEATRINKLDKNSKEWETKNNEVMDIAKYMRITGIPQLEQSGKYKGLPTKEELELMKRLSTTMSIEEIEKILEKYGYKFKQKYIFTK
jgi:hypothetical protein